MAESISVPRRKSGSMNPASVLEFWLEA